MDPTSSSSCSPPLHKPCSLLALMMLTTLPRTPQHLPCWPISSATSKAFLKASKKKFLKASDGKKEAWGDARTQLRLKKQEIKDRWAGTYRFYRARQNREHPTPARASESDNETSARRQPSSESTKDLLLLKPHSLLALMMLPSRLREHRGPLRSTLNYKYSLFLVFVHAPSCRKVTVPDFDLNTAWLAPASWRGEQQQKSPKQVSDLALRSTGQGAKDKRITAVFQVRVFADSAFFPRVQHQAGYAANVPEKMLLNCRQNRGFLFFLAPPVHMEELRRIKAEFMPHISKNGFVHIVGQKLVPLAKRHEYKGGGLLDPELLKKVYYTSLISILSEIRKREGETSPTTINSALVVVGMWVGVVGRKGGREEGRKEGKIEGREEGKVGGKEGRKNRREGRKEGKIGGREGRKSRREGGKIGGKEGGKEGKIGGREGRKSRREGRREGRKEGKVGGREGKKEGKKEK
ncbi:cshA, partial [Ophiophagus hannah]